jgi:outer membrane lipoprotein
VISLVVALQSGCVHYAISEQFRLQADRTLALTQLRAAPEAYRDRTMIVGGDILRTSQAQEGTLLEVLHKPLDAADRPLLTDHSAGRFLVYCDTYLDPAIYAPGRTVTVAGRVLGTRTDKVGDIDYVYPLLACLQLYLWPQPVYVYEPYPYGWHWWYWEPWYWGSPRHHFRRPWSWPHR